MLSWYGLSKNTSNLKASTQLIQQDSRSVDDFNCSTSNTCLVYKKTNSSFPHGFTGDPVTRAQANLKSGGPLALL